MLVWLLGGLDDWWVAWLLAWVDVSFDWFGLVGLGLV